MKKCIYSLALLVMGFASCTTWDDPVTEKYDAGPAVDINVMAVEPSDSAFKVTITPAAGTTYYAFLIEKGSEAKARDGYTLLKGGYSNTVVSASEKNPTDSLFKAEPNTTYQVYAVACNDKGIVGDVVVKNITTTDQNAPTPLKFTADRDTKSATVEFNQTLKRGEGLVKGIYYKEWDWDNPVALTSEDIEVTIDGKNVTFAAPEAPAGAFIGFSWEKGAFVDAAGNQCTAFTSSYDEKKDDFVGVWVHAANESFEVADSCVTAPKKGKFTDWTAFAGELTFEFDIFRNDEKTKDGDLLVVYTGKKRTVTYKLSTKDWAVSGNKLTFKLPVAPEEGDLVALQIAEGVIFDVYGNPNKAYESKQVWEYTSYVPVKEDVLGTFNYSAAFNAGGKDYKFNLGNFTISEYTGEDAEEGDVVISDFYLEGSEIYGYYDLEAGMLYIYNYQKVGTYVDKNDGNTYGVVTYNDADSKAKVIAFELTKDGMISKDFALVYTDEAYEKLIGYEIPSGEAVLKKVTASAKAKTKAKVGKKTTIAKKVKGTPKKVKNIRK